MTDEDGLDPWGPDEEGDVAADLVWSVREELPERRVVTARTIPFEEAFHHKDDIAFTPVGRPSPAQPRADPLPGRAPRPHRAV